MIINKQTEKFGSTVFRILDYFKFLNDTGFNTKYKVLWTCESIIGTVGHLNITEQELD